jgi:hypothetical protein
MPTQSEELLFETGQAGLVSPCGSAPSIDPPAHVYQATSMVVAPTPLGTTLPVPVSTAANVSTFTFPAVKGEPGVNTTPILFPKFVGTGFTALPQSNYTLKLTWPATAGSFAPFALCAALDVSSVAHFNRHDGLCSVNSYGWTFGVPANPAAPYTGIQITINLATLAGNWNAQTSSPIQGTWTLTAA